MTAGNLSWYFSVFLCCMFTTFLSAFLMTMKWSWKTPLKSQPQLPADLFVATDFLSVTSHLIVYSAYYDDIFSSEETVITIIGMADYSELQNDSIICSFFNENFVEVLHSRAQPVPSEDSYSRLFPFVFSFFKCPLNQRGRFVMKDSREMTPTYVKVEVSSEKMKKPSGILKIQYPPAIESVTVGACVQPLHSGINNPLQLLEWIEYNKLMGLEHITFYNASIGPKVEELLRSYSVKEICVLPWNITVPEPSWGQFIAATDCAFRYRGVAKYVLNFDIDEFLITPANFTSFPQLFSRIWNDMEKDGVTQLHSVIFMGKLCFNNWPKAENSSELSEKYPGYGDVLGQLQLPFVTTVSPGLQTKFVFRPKLVIESGVHAVTKAVANSELYLPKDLGFHVHFRDCVGYYQVPNEILFNNATCNNTAGMEKNTEAAERIGPLLITNVMHKINSSNLLRNTIKNMLQRNSFNSDD